MWIVGGPVDLSGALGQDVGQDVVPVLRGKFAVLVAVRRAMCRTRVNEILSGSRSAASAARVT